MSVTLRFDPLHGGDVEFHGPAPYWRLAGFELQRGPERQRLAHHEGHMWCRDAHKFLKFEALQPIEVHFENAHGAATTRRFGPFVRFAVVNGTANGDGETLAELDERSNAWCCLAQGSWWPSLILCPVRR